ncbi:MAG: HAD hydrolase, family IA, variant 3 [Candidatus Roizmanbacteria bacterium GW2011_GWA2_35_19]|uniref:HAD hydrolase, family IA, variant 3 n=1 Tax=Candidatus Roizmanbacteria bacterium GW2011_GWA2_35_19 TaxID=1618478 RepID=A0A0G0BWS1_9BACT|nr:MAG: HAD hydrolase, family IA, variant 3 [Candidatus Roizmanbacteria bacterium GW2011_GWA2_35_19]
MNDWSNYFKTVTRKFNIPHKEFVEFWHSGDDSTSMTRGIITPEDFWKEAINKFNLKSAEDFDFLESWMGDCKPRKEVHSLVHKLVNKYKIGIISNIYKGMMPRLIEIGIVPDVKYSAVVLSCDVGFKKPEKEIYEIATKKAGMKPSGIFLIDDRRDFAKGAESAGWNTYRLDEKNIKKSVEKIEKILLSDETYLSV